MVHGLPFQPEPLKRFVGLTLNSHINVSKLKAVRANMRFEIFV